MDQPEAHFVIASIEQFEEKVERLLLYLEWHAQNAFKQLMELGGLSEREARLAFMRTTFIKESSPTAHLTDILVALKVFADTGRIFNPEAPYEGLQEAFLSLRDQSTASLEGDINVREFLKQWTQLKFAEYFKFQEDSFRKWGVPSLWNATKSAGQPAYEEIVSRKGRRPWWFGIASWRVTKTVEDQFFKMGVLLVVNKFDEAWAAIERQIFPEEALKSIRPEERPAKGKPLQPEA